MLIHVSISTVSSMCCLEGWCETTTTHSAQPLYRPSNEPGISQILSSSTCWAETSDVLNSVLTQSTENIFHFSLNCNNILWNPCFTSTTYLFCTGWSATRPEFKWNAVILTWCSHFMHHTVWPDIPNIRHPKLNIVFATLIFTHILNGLTKCCYKAPYSYFRLHNFHVLDPAALSLILHSICGGPYRSVKEGFQCK